LIAGRSHLFDGLPNTPRDIGASHPAFHVEPSEIAHQDVDEQLVVLPPVLGDDGGELRKSRHQIFDRLVRVHLTIVTVAIPRLARRPSESFGLGSTTALKQPVA
jgi:hypothetical protein